MRLMLASLSALTVIAIRVTNALAQAPASESNATEAPQSSVLLQVAALLVVLACVLVAFRFYSAIRGGRVARGWMWVFTGFVVFAGGQLLLLGGSFGMLPVAVIWVDTLRVISLLLFFVGINQLRKIVA